METQTQPTQEGKATIILTYNSVRNFPAGTYKAKNGPLVIYSHENARTWGEAGAEGKLSEILHGLYDRVNPQDVEHIYLYVGLYAKEGALRAAQRLAGDGNRLTLVACDCDAGEKQAAANRIGAPIIWADCGGRGTLEEIARSLTE
jgi:hypothetical protein